MAATGGKAAASGVAGMVSKLVKAPWKYTGPASHPEFKESLVKAGEYRPVAPTNAPAPIVPAAETERIFDIKYFTRDRRRQEYEVKEDDVTVDALAAEAATAELPPTPGRFYFYGKDYHINDAPGDGYQK